MRNNKKSMSDLSHEVRTPLGIIMGFSELLQDENLSALERRRFTGIIAKNCRTLSHAVDEVLNISPLRPVRTLLPTPKKPTRKYAQLSPEYSLRNKNILLIEDSIDNQLLIGRILEKNGASLEFSNNGRDGIRRATHQSYHLVLTDLQMPLMDGFEVIKTLRERGMKVPIVAFTANAVAEFRERCFQSGCNGFLTKPVDPKQLVSTLTECLTHNET